MRFHVRLASSEAARDGLVEIFINEKKAIDARSLALPARSAGHYISSGYLMGWSNSGYDADTRFLIDRVRVYATDPKW
jgi:hypothetical protein